MLGAVQRGGKVFAQLVPNLTGRTLLEFIRRAVHLKDSERIAADYPACNPIRRELKHLVINHKNSMPMVTRTQTPLKGSVVIKRA